MPILSYFLWAGGALLGLLFVADWYLPEHPSRAEVHYTYHIPIASSVRAGPQPITFSGETRHFGPPPPMTVVDYSARPVGAQTAALPAMQANAEMATPSSSASQHAEPARQKVAKRKIHRRRVVTDHDAGILPGGWRPEAPPGMAFARPLFW